MNYPGRSNPPGQGRASRGGLGGFWRYAWGARQ